MDSREADMSKRAPRNDPKAEAIMRLYNANVPILHISKATGYSTDHCMKIVLACRVQTCLANAP